LDIASGKEKDGLQDANYLRAWKWGSGNVGSGNYLRLFVFKGFA